MNYWKIIGSLVLITAALPITICAQKTPNIVFILADDMGQGDVQAYNKAGKIATPNIDRLAHEGVLFTDAHTNSSVCTPTRYGILTGRYAWRTSLKKGVLGGHSSHLIDTDRETVASLLKNRGYQTACFGKWHLGMDWVSKDGQKIKNSKPTNVDFSAPIQNGPLDLGFDYFFGIAGSLNMDPHAFIENRSIQGSLMMMNNIDELDAKGFTQPSKPGWAAKEYRQDQVLSTLTDKACGWIQKHADKPFFLYFPLSSPHAPIVPSARFLNKSNLSLYGDYCMETDWVVGRVLKTLDELNLTENTIVVFTSDNGTSDRANLKEMQDKGHFTSYIYRGLKGTTWEGGHRVPFIVRWPGVAKASSVVSEAICTTDFFATCAQLTQTPITPNVGEDSYSFLPALKGKPLKGFDERIMVHHSDAGVFAVRKGKWKLMLDNRGGSKRFNPKDKPVINNADVLLFDMEKDSVESTNLSGKYPEVVEALKRDLAQTIITGRSTPGPQQPNDLKEALPDWPQLKPIMKYLNVK